MALVPMVEKGKALACQADWPLFYMNDFSRLGIVVSGLAEARAVLAGSGYRVVDDNGAVLVDAGDRLADLFAVLAAHRLAYELSDLVTCVYQG